MKWTVNWFGPSHLPEYYRIAAGMPNSGEARGVRRKLEEQMMPSDNRSRQNLALTEQSAAKATCGSCEQALSAYGELYGCTFEHTFCAGCAAKAQYICGHCGGELSLKDELGADEKPAAERNQPWLIWVASFGVWSIAALAAGATIYRLYRTTRSPMALTSALGMQFCQILTYAPLTPFAFAFATRYPIRRNNWVTRSLLYLAAGLVFTVAHVALQSMTPFGFWDPNYHEWRSAIWDSHDHAFGILWSVLPEQFLTSLFNDIFGAFIPVTLVAHIVSHTRTLRERELRAVQLEEQLTKTRLQVLKSQLQPHFLFNTMHSISSLMLTDVRAADRMLTRLGDLLRMCLELTGTQITTLSREIEFVNCYLEIEKARFAERLTVAFDISPETLDALVPHLLLQPLVDNAVKHGVSRLPGGGEIRIAATTEARQLKIEICDNGPGISNTGTLPSGGLGLRITRERLRSLYGHDQSLELFSLPEGGTRAQVSIPFLARGRADGQDTATVSRTDLPAPCC
jgi:two-component system, LytTR family, sensor kinase